MVTLNRYLHKTAYNNVVSHIHGVEILWIDTISADFLANCGFFKFAHQVIRRNHFM